MLETLRGKRMMYIGDSLNRGQYVSMICLLHSIIPEDAKSFETFGSLTVFTAKVTFIILLISFKVSLDIQIESSWQWIDEFEFDVYVQEYNATIEFYWAPFLLESNSDDAVIHRVSDRIVRKGSVNKHGKHWKGVDIIVFNTYLWWMTGLKMKIMWVPLHTNWCNIFECLMRLCLATKQMPNFSKCFRLGSFDDEVKNIVELSTEDAYRMAMKSMLRWVRLNMDRKKTRVFFTSMSPTHAKWVKICMYNWPVFIILIGMN